MLAIVLLLNLSATIAIVSSSHSPVIAILSQPDPDHADSFYIAASYVKWLEAGGARSIPIPYDATPELFDRIYSETNGLLIPGGASSYPEILTYALDNIVEDNNAGFYYPVWGTCMGFEFLITYAGGELQPGFDAENITLPLENPQRVELYEDPWVFEAVQNYPITMNNHHQGISPSSFLANDMLPQLWNITSVNHDRKGKPFVSSIEPVHPESFPFYGVQYHPEKNAFEYATYPGTNTPYEAIDHSERGVTFSLHMARFFVNLTRKSIGHDFYGDFQYVQEYPIATGLKFEQKYLIPHSQAFQDTSYSSTKSLRASR